MKKLWKSLTYEKLRMNMWFSKILQKSYENLGQVMQNLWLTYDITGILQKHKIRGKWGHLGNPPTEAVIGQTLWAKNN